MRWKPGRQARQACGNEHAQAPQHAGTSGAELPGSGLGQPRRRGEHRPQRPAGADQLEEPQADPGAPGRRCGLRHPAPLDHLPQRVVQDRVRRALQQIDRGSAAGNYRAEHLTDVIEATYTDLRATANPNHLVAAGWIAIPTDTTLEEIEAANIFNAVGAWSQQKVQQICKPKIYTLVIYRGALPEVCSL